MTTKDEALKALDVLTSAKPDLAALYKARATLLDYIESTAQPVVPEGWKLVPVEPTLEMFNAAEATGRHCYTGAFMLEPFEVYAAMLAAAPAPAADAKGGMSAFCSKCGYDHSVGPLCNERFGAKEAICET